MRSFTILFSFLLIFWILLTGFSYQEVLVGVVVSGFVSFALRDLFKGEVKNFFPRFFYFLGYIPYYIFQEILAHLEVIYRILTGKINPGIIEIKPKHKSKFGLTVLANSITMTPGTLTLDIKGKRLFIHCLSIKPKKKIMKFEKILKKIWD